jgi:hypothetical protein
MRQGGLAADATSGFDESTSDTQGNSKYHHTADKLHDSQHKTSSRLLDLVNSNKWPRPDFRFKILEIESL